MIKRLGRLAALSGLGIVMFLSAWLLINTTFMIYDDEGYVLLTYQNFMAGGRLYDDIFTQYGPWPYVYHLAVDSVLQMPITHAIGRNLTAIHWTLSALLVGAITYRLTEQKICGLFAAVISFGLLRQMTGEPSHPGSMICVILAGSTLLIINAHMASESKWRGITIGLTAALLTLTKINVGLLFIAGVGIAGLRLTAWPVRLQTFATTLASLGLLLVPWALMWNNLHHTWVLILAIQFTLGAAGILWVTPVCDEARRIRPRIWLISLAVSIGTIIAITAVVCSRGTSLPTLLQAVLVNPLHHPANIVIGFTWPTSIWPISCICFLLTGLAGWELRHQGFVRPVTALVLIIIRMACAAIFVFHLKSWETMIGISEFVFYCLPLMPVFLITLASRKNTTYAKVFSARLWVAAIAFPQILHMYPIAGSQAGWGSFSMLPIMVAGLVDAWTALVESWPRLKPWLPSTIRTVLVAASCVYMVSIFHTGWNRYHTSKPFNLAGAESIRADDRTRLVLRVLTQNTMIHADMLFSSPGMFSHNLWSGITTPTKQNTTTWFWLLDYQAQNAIISCLQKAPRSVIISNRILEDFLIRINAPVACPLRSFITKNYQSLFNLDGFFFLIPAGAKAVPFGRIEVFLATPDSATSATMLLQTNLALNGQLDSMQIQAINHPWQVRETFSPTNSRLVLQPINAAGNITGPDITLPHAQPLHGLFRLNLYLHHAVDLNQPHQLELVGLDPQGNILSESAF